MKFTFQLHNLNVWLTLTVLLILHALMRNVKTHALRCPAGFGPTARLKTTEQFACADRDSLATPMRSAKNVSSKWLFFTNLKSHSKVLNFSLLSLAIAGCKSDDECPTTEACYNRECLDPCTFEKCGLNAECSVRNHRATCKCRPGYKGNPYERCRQYECLSDPECADYLACRNEKCVDPCGDCSVNADCTARNHRAICECRIGYTGNPYGSVCSKSKHSKCLDLTFGAPLNNHHFLFAQYQNPRLSVQQTGTVQADNPACRRNAKTLAWPYPHAPPMQIAQFTTHFHSEQCLAPAYQVILVKVMSAVRK